ncbi:MAG TPA: hypothetical protein VM261_39455 [Kofleriaceae bacterium]|nr:hypothetical protein [Kofleriaceae bacterium]
MNTICVAAVAATLVAGIIASVAAPNAREPRAKCRDHRRHTVELAPAEMTITPPPRAATCSDPVAGTWVADEFRPEQADWIEHELRISVDDDGYRVAHTARLRDGDARGHARLDCMPDAIEFDTSGRAKLEGDQLHVRGKYLEATRARCTGETLTYDLDYFTGTLAGDTFDSVNNDGNTARDRPYHFRRIACA